VSAETVRLSIEREYEQQNIPIPEWSESQHDAFVLTSDLFLAGMDILLEARIPVETVPDYE
jgi:hypothetical protein